MPLPMNDKQDKSISVMRNATDLIDFDFVVGALKFIISVRSF